PAVHGWRRNARPAHGRPPGWGPAHATERAPSNAAASREGPAHGRRHRPLRSAARRGGWERLSWLRGPENNEPGVFRAAHHRAAPPDGRSGGEIALCDLALLVTDHGHGDQVPGPGGSVAGLDHERLAGVDRLDHTALVGQRLRAPLGLDGELAVHPA